MGAYLLHVFAALSCLINTLIGGPSDESLSARVGVSILRKGLASRIPFPIAVRDHFVDAAIRMLSLRNKQHG